MKQPLQGQTWADRSVDTGIDRVIVFTSKDLHWIVVALKGQLERERRLLELLEKTRIYVEDLEAHERQLAVQYRVVDGYERLLAQVHLEPDEAGCNLSRLLVNRLAHLLRKGAGCNPPCLPEVH